MHYAVLLFKLTDQDWSMSLEAIMLKLGWQAHWDSSFNWMPLEDQHCCPVNVGVKGEPLLLALVLLHLCIVLSDPEQVTKFREAMKQTSKNKKKAQWAACIADRHASFETIQQDTCSSGGVPAAFSCSPPMPACMSAMQSSHSGSTMQLQKHAAVASAVQPAFAIIVGAKM